MHKLYRLTLATALAAGLSTGMACSASQDAHTGSAETAVDDAGQIVMQRYILTLSADKDGAVPQRDVSKVMRALEKAGAEQVELLEGLPIIVVTAPQAAIDGATDTGLVVSVQQDSLSKPYQD